MPPDEAQAWVRNVTGMPDWVKPGAKVVITGFAPTAVVVAYDMSYVYLDVGAKTPKAWTHGRFLQFWSPVVRTRFERVG